MLVNKSTLSLIFTNLKTNFNKALKSATPMWDQVAMKIPSTGSENSYAWFGNFPRLRKWVGEKVVKSLAAHKYTVVNDDYESTVGVRRNDIEDDNLGIYKLQAEAAGEAAKMWPDDIVFTCVNNAFTEKCYDGKPFFASNHPNGDKQTFSNSGTKKLDASSLAAAQASYGAARTALRKMKDEDGKPLAINPNLLLVPPALEDVANALVTAERLDDGKTNIYKGTCKVLVCPHLTSDTAWFLLDTTQVLRPFLFQERKAPVLVSQTDMSSDAVFDRAEYKFGAEARGAAGYGLPQLAYGSKGTAAAV